MKITGIQNRPATAYSPSEVESQSSVIAVCDSSISTPPVTGCSSTAVSVNSMSANTTVDAVRAMKAASPLRCAISMKNAMPLPVPRMTMAPSTCRYLTRKYSVIAFWPHLGIAASGRDRVRLRRF